MALDIRSGDFLVIGTKQYPIRYCGEYEFSFGSTRSFKQMCSVSASTKRNPIADGKRGDAVEQEASIKCMPLDPVSQTDIEKRGLTNAPYELKQTVVDGGDTFYQLFVEVIKKA